MPLKVHALSFWTKDINQSSPYPCAFNTISVTLDTSVPLLVNSMYPSLQCQPTITIKGLKGSQTASTPSLAVILNGGGKFASSASWTQDDGDIVFTVLASTTAGQEMHLSFNLTNKAAPQSSPTGLFCLASINGVEHSMVRDGAALAHIFETKAGMYAYILTIAHAIQARTQ